MITMFQHFYLEGYGATLRVAPDQCMAYAKKWTQVVPFAHADISYLSMMSRPGPKGSTTQIFRTIFELFDQCSPGLVDEAHIGLSTEPEGFGLVVDYTIKPSQPDTLFLSLDRRTEGETEDDTTIEHLLERVEIKTVEELERALAPFSQAFSVHPTDTSGHLEVVAPQGSAPLYCGGYNAVVDLTFHTNGRKAPQWKVLVDNSQFYQEDLPKMIREPLTANIDQIRTALFAIGRETTPHPVRVAQVWYSTRPNNRGTIIHLEAQLYEPGIYVSVSHQADESDVATVQVERRVVLTPEDFYDTFLRADLLTTIMTLRAPELPRPGSDDFQLTSTARHELHRQGMEAKLDTLRATDPKFVAYDIGDETSSLRNQRLGRLTPPASTKLPGTAIEDLDHQTLWVETKDYISSLSSEDHPDGSIASLLRELVMQYTQPCPPSIANIERLWTMLPTCGFTIGIVSMFRMSDYPGIIKAITDANTQGRDA